MIIEGIGKFILDCKNSLAAVLNALKNLGSGTLARAAGVVGGAIVSYRLFANYVNRLDKESKTYRVLNGFNKYVICGPITLLDTAINFCYDQAAKFGSWVKAKFRKSEEKEVNEVADDLAKATVEIVTEA